MLLVDISKPNVNSASESLCISFRSDASIRDSDGRFAYYFDQYIYSTCLSPFFDFIILVTLVNSIPSMDEQKNIKRKVTS